MKVPLKDKSADLVETLHKGNMLSHPVLKGHVEYALTTNNYNPLLNYLKSYPIFLAHAKRNIAVSEYQLLENPFPHPHRDDAKEYLIGPLKFGYINLFDDMFGIDWDTLSMPVINAGRVKSGKSILAKYILCQALRRPRDFNVLIPDLKKEYRNLLSYPRHLKVLKKENIQINPFEVPYWRHPMDHIFAVARVFVSENYLVGTSMNELINVLEWLYVQKGVFANSRNFPTVIDVYKVISARLRDKYWGRYTDVFRWLQNRLLPYTKSEAFICQHGIPFDVLRTENLVLEMDKGFTDLMYNFTVAHLAELFYSHNKEKSLIGSKLRHLFNVDEARILFDANRDSSQFGESIINEIVSKSREFGIGFFLSSQESVSFNQLIRSLAYLKIAFPLNDAKDLQFIQESFGLNEDQTAYLFKLPPFGRAVVRYGGYENPFLLAVPYLNLKKTVSDEEVEAQMADFYAQLRDKMKVDKEPVQIHHQPETMPPNAASLLYFLGKEPFTRKSDMTSAPGFKSPTEVNKALGYLEKNGFINQESHKVSRRGRKSIFAVLTAKAYKYLKIIGIPGKGEFEHKLYQHLICKKIEKDDLEAKIEGIIKGTQKSIDVLTRSKNGNYIAYEVTLHLENLLSNIRQDIAAGVSKIVIVTRDTPYCCRSFKDCNCHQGHSSHGKSSNNG
jgi:hypothetical protein